MHAQVVIDGEPEAAVRLEEQLVHAGPIFRPARILQRGQVEGREITVGRVVRIDLCDLQTLPASDDLQEEIDQLSVDIIGCRCRTRERRGEKERKQGASSHRWPSSPTTRRARAADVGAGRPGALYGIWIGATNVPQSEPPEMATYSPATHTVDGETGSRAAAE